LDTRLVVEGTLAMLRLLLLLLSPLWLPSCELLLIVIVLLLLVLLLLVLLLLPS
jgi:hypothetical protein